MVNTSSVPILYFDMDMSKSPGDKDFEWVIQLNYRSFELLGLWPNTNGSFKRSFSSNIRAGFVFIMVIFFLAVPLVHALMRVWGDMTLTIDNLRITLPVLMALLKFIILLWKQSELSSVINMMREDWMTLKIDAERDIMINRMRTARLIVISIYVLSVCTLIVMAIFPLFGLSIRQHTNLTDRRKPFMLQAYYIYDTDKSPQFELTYFTQVLGMSLAAITYVLIETFFLLLIFHMCGQFEKFRQQLVNLIMDKEFNKILDHHITTHIRLIRYANSVEDIFTLMTLGLITYLGITLCLAIFVLLLMINKGEINAASFTRIYYMIAAILFIFTQMFLYCLAGELLTEQCEAAYRDLCNLKWYKWGSKQARNIIIIMIRIQEPLYITAGRILPLTMTTFCSLLKTTASYISFLLAVQD